ncbi:uncharacterized protein Dyak_GE18022 [Drosophila yakuba]|uniref:Kazal-like domain-containing protein n=1 Tax=Drosophila yakuba TaxID=7245 RepID=B4PC30_DROYA|nr:uncharacterized protein Dyak_GE18022 [Drosophila yakuba]
MASIAADGFFLGIVLLLIGTIHGFPSFDNTGQLQPRFQCLQSCLTTSEYNPVCSSDMVSYDNESKLNCAIQCGLDIRLAYTGKCRRPPRESLPRLPSTMSE